MYICVCIYIYTHTHIVHIVDTVGRDSVFVIAACYELDGPGFDSRWGKFFRTHPGRPYGPPNLLYNGYCVSFLGVKRPGRSVDYQTPSGVEVKERVQLYIYSPSVPSCPAVG